MILFQDSSEREVLGSDSSAYYVWDDIVLPHKLVVIISGNDFHLFLPSFFFLFAVLTNVVPLCLVIFNVCELLYQNSVFAMLWCDKHPAIHIVSNSVFHKMTKYIQIGCHFAGEKVQQKIISTGHIRIENN